jgi:hypothetical protein
LPTMVAVILSKYVPIPPSAIARPHRPAACSAHTNAARARKTTAPGHALVTHRRALIAVRPDVL